MQENRLRLAFAEPNQDPLPWFEFDQVRNNVWLKVYHQTDNFIDGKEAWFNLTLRPINYNRIVPVINKYLNRILQEIYIPVNSGYVYLMSKLTSEMLFWSDFVQYKWPELIEPVIYGVDE
jgi:hypothetical protein